jgi:hypothetical protein
MPGTKVPPTQPPPTATEAGLPEGSADLVELLRSLKRLLLLIDQSQEVLFHRRFRRNLSPAIADAVERLDERMRLPQLRSPNDFPEMVTAGLTGPQLRLKLAAYNAELEAFEETAHPSHLEGVLDAGATVSKSIADAIPGFGSFLSELLDFLFKELKKRWRFWRR